MTKADMVDKIAVKTGMTKAAGEKVLNAFLDSVQEALVAEGRLNLSGFGSFVVETRQERKARNPRTNEIINVPASKVVKFRSSTRLKDTIK